MDDIIDSPGMATCCDGRRAAVTVERLAVTEARPKDTAISFRRNEEGREFRRRAVAGELAPHDISRVPECFHAALLKHLASPTNPNPKVRKSGAVGKAVLASVVMMMMD